MLKEERQQRLLEILADEGKLIATEASARLNVSEDTVRRDLREMDAQGLLYRVHGGALPKASTSPGYWDNERPEEKEWAMALAALPLVRSGMVILMDGSPVTLLLAKMIPRQMNATVVTNSPLAASALAAHPGLDIYMLGGRLVREYMVNLGLRALDELRTIRADICFLGLPCVHAEIGVSVAHAEVAMIKREMMLRSREVAALVPAERLGVSAPFVAGSASELTRLITAGVSEEQLSPYRRLGIDIMLA